MKLLAKVAPKPQEDSIPFDAFLRQVTHPKTNPVCSCRTQKRRKKHAKATVATKSLQNQQCPSIIDASRGFEPQYSFYVRQLFFTKQNADLRARKRLANINRLGGFSNTATAILATLYCVLRNPECLSHIQQELRDEFSSLDQIANSRVQQLPLLNGCIREALRLFPPVSGRSSSRFSPGTNIQGIYVPKGVKVSADIYSLHRSPSLWAHSDEFRPERWYCNGPGTPFEGDVRTTFRPFGLGSRVCLGQELSYHQIRLIVAVLLFRYDMIEVDNSAVWEKDALSYHAYSGFKLVLKLGLHAGTPIDADERS